MLIKYARAEVVVWWGATDHRERCRCLLQRMMVVLWWGIGSCRQGLFGQIRRAARWIAARMRQ